MITIEINNVEEVNAILQRIADKVQDRSDLMADLAQTMKKAVNENFEQQGRPSWLGLKQPNKRNHILRGESGNLESGIYAESNNNAAIVATNTIYAPVHQFGTKKAGRRRNTEIPARPFLSLTEQDEEDLLADVQDYFRTLV